AAFQRCQRYRNGIETQKQGWRFSFRRAKIASPSRPRGLALRQCVRDTRVLRIDLIVKYHYTLPTCMCQPCFVTLYNTFHLEISSENTARDASIFPKDYMETTQ